jgi:phycobilisome rod-core linker protein
MSLPLLTYPLSSQNQRVSGYEIPGDEHPKLLTTDDSPKGTEIDEIIWACYRQVFNEQQIIRHHRQLPLESQLRYGLITVRDFIRGLALSESFRRLNYETNNNYRFAEMCIQRLLGRQVYDEREKLAWSIVLATKGLRGFIDELISSDEYQENFGDNVVPYQRRRILPQRSRGELPFARMARYDSYYLGQLQQLGQLRSLGNGAIDRSAKVYRKVILAVPTVSVALLVATLILVAAPK